MNYCFNHNIEFETEELYIRHQAICDELLRSKRFVCMQYAEDGSMCGDQFGLLGNLFIHAKEVHKVILCLKCDEQSTSQVEMDRHKCSEPLKNPRRCYYRCEYCPQMFATSGHLSQHVAAHLAERIAPIVHNQNDIPFQYDGKKMKCPCGKIYTQSSHFYRHVPKYQSLMATRQASKLITGWRQ